MGLIKKTTINDTKKPAFNWIGTSGLDVFAANITHEKENSI